MIMEPEFMERGTPALEILIMMFRLAELYVRIEPHKPDQKNRRYTYYG